MNIQEAKEEVIRAVKAYTAKNEEGEYLIPVSKQRPLLLMGAPGIGKTSIVEQAARECGINLVSYTITHHTRQSAIGLPFIAHRSYGGKEVSVTEYSMSEIIASVYDQIEQSGVSEGILFLDEINCVSETLSPTMLQFLQYKTFGTHHLPEGFIVVTAGNPPEYNKSVREFDIVTLDRIRRLDVDADLPTFLSYAREENIHGAVIAYLEIRKDHFYSIRTDVENRYFVTARGWEDLSLAIQTYEKLNLPVTKNLIGEYLQDPEIAEDFAGYYELYCKYAKTYCIPEILNGTIREDSLLVKDAPFDERLSLIELLAYALHNDFVSCANEKEKQKLIYEILLSLRQQVKEGSPALDALKCLIQENQRNWEKKRQAKLVRKEEEHAFLSCGNALHELEQILTLQGTGEGKHDFLLAKSWFDKREEERKKKIDRTGEHITHAFTFLSRCFGEGQEMVIFLTAVSQDKWGVQFLEENGNEAYFHYNKLLLLNERKEVLTQDVLKLMP